MTAQNPPSQRDRIVAYLRAHGSVNTTTFHAPYVADSLKPITRLAARIDELKKAGWLFEVSKEKNGTATYHVVEDPAVGKVAPSRVDVAAGDDSGSLFDAGAFGASTSPYREAA